MAELRRSGIRVRVPPGWEGSISGGNFALQAHGARRPNVMHLANMPLPPQREDFGGDVARRLGRSGILITLFEYEPESADTPLFAAEGIPRPLAAHDFDPQVLQVGVAGQTGIQRFFSHQGRAFCLYVVLGSHIDRADLVPAVNAVLDTLIID